jgi:predicted lipid-binding transport protein (Tim44 family)
MTNEEQTRSTATDDASERPGSRAADVGTSALLGGAAAGALAGTLAGPVGAAIGAAIGAVAAGFAGNAISASVERTVEEAHWRENFKQRPYVTHDAEFDDYGPAYGHGVDTYVANSGRSFDEVEPELAQAWPAARGNSRLDWDRARPASRDAWDRLTQRRS